MPCPMIWRITEERPRWATARPVAHSTYFGAVTPGARQIDRCGAAPGHTRFWRRLSDASGPVLGSSWTTSFAQGVRLGSRWGDSNGAGRGACPWRNGRETLRAMSVWPIVRSAASPCPIRGARIGKTSSTAGDATLLRGLSDRLEDPCPITVRPRASDTTISSPRATKRCRAGRGRRSLGDSPNPKSLAERNLSDRRSILGP